MTKEQANNLKQGVKIFYAGAFYEFAEIKEFPHGIMIGVYDEGKSKHVDYLNPESVSEVIPCYACQGGGCPVCSGLGVLIQ
jgi:hypothetical protein